MAIGKATAALPITASAVPAFGRFVGMVELLINGLVVVVATGTGQQHQERRHPKEGWRR